MAGLRTADRPSTVKPPIIIIAASEMDTATFAAHFSKRHKGSLADMPELPANIDFNVEQSYRAFHNRLHGLRKYKHQHEQDSPEVSIDRAIECLFENRNWGWKQLAGIEGLVAVFQARSAQIQAKKHATSAR
jgi:hypothetical protein